ncbi:MAG: NFACT family protein, partial [Clostridiales bacterium]|nr:NFACT family protein [Clostridiales bacterium]
MAFDAGMAAAVVRELSREIISAKVEKIFQPTKDEIILSCRKDKRAMKLLISANPSCARVCLCSLEKENPQPPPMLCMLLRKHLQGAVISDVSMYGFERVIEIKFKAYDDLGFPCEKYLTAEIMGKCSNIFLLVSSDNKKKIAGALKSADFSSGIARPALVGMEYTLPPPQDKTNPLCEDEAGFMQKLKNYPPDKSADKFILDTYLGISPLVARECAYTARADSVGTCSPRMLYASFEKIISAIKNGNFKPCAIIRDGKLIEYSFIQINQYEKSAEIKEFATFSELLDFYFGERERVQTMHAKAHDIDAIVTSARKKLQRKLPLLKSELDECAEAEKFKLWGDLITSSIYKLTKKAESCEVVNYYSESLENVVIPLDVRYTPSQNAARYFKKYTKLKTAKKILMEQIEKAERELAYLDSVVSLIPLAENEAELYEIRIELAEAGYSPKTAMINKAKSHAKFIPKHFVTSGGYELFVGKNNIQNDRLTTKLASKSD